MREEIEGLDAVDLVALLDEALEVPHLGSGVTGDVDDFAGAEVEELLEEVLAAALAGWVDDDAGFLGLEGDVGEEVFGRGGDEGGVFDAVGEGVSAGPVGGGFGKLDADDLVEVFGEAKAEESGAAVGIEEVFLAGAFRLFGSVAGEGFENEGVVLEEVAGEEIESEVANFF